MKKNEILLDLEKIFQTELDDPSIKLTYESTTEDVRDWDSITHIMLVFAIESHYSIKFSSQETMSWNNIGELIKCIESKI